jgi:hypothetical protein
MWMRDRKGTRGKSGSLYSICIILLTGTFGLLAQSERAPAKWLYTQRGTGYGVKNVGIVVSDFQGNLVVAAKARDITNLTGHYRPPTAESVNPEHLVLAKYASDERLIWCRKLAEEALPQFTQLVTDRTGNIYGIACLKEDTRLFGGGTVRTLRHRGGGDILLLKWSATGDLIYVHHLGGKDREFCSGLALKPGDGVVLVGEFNGTLELPGRSAPITFHRTGLGQDFFVAEFGEDGKFRWAQQIQAAEFTLPGAIAADDQGNCFVTGGFNQVLRFADAEHPVNLESRGDMDLFVAKYSSNGTLAWVRQAGGPGDEYGTSVKWDYTGCCYLFGRFGKDARFGEGSSEIGLECLGRADMFMACYSPAGEFLGALRVGGGNVKLDAPWTIIVDELGNRYVVGGMDKVKYWPRPLAAVALAAGSPALLEAAAAVTSVPPARFAGIAQAADGSIQIELEGRRNATYIIEASVDLHEWIPVSTNRVLDGRIVLEDTQAANEPVQFYRIRQP